MDAHNEATEALARSALAKIERHARIMRERIELHGRADDAQARELLAESVQASWTELRMAWAQLTTVRAMNSPDRPPTGRADKSEVN